MSKESDLTLQNMPEVDINLTEVPMNESGKVDADAFRRSLERIHTFVDEIAPLKEEVAREEVPVAEHEAEQERAEVSFDNEPEDEEEFAGHTIPKKRFNKEIEKRRQLEMELQKERDERVRYQTELDLYNKALEKLKAGENKQPEFDPIDEDAHNVYMKKIRELEEKFENQSRQVAHSSEQAQFERVVNAQQQEFTKKQPDFDVAYRHLVDAEINAAKNFASSDQEAQQIALGRLYQIANNSLKNGKDVAATFYNMSKSYGYSGGQQSKPRGDNLEAVAKNMRGSANAAREVPGVNMKPAVDVGVYAALDRFDDKFMNQSGRGVNASEFHKALEQLRSGSK